MKYKIEKLDDSSVVYMRMIGTYQSDKNFEMMKTFKHWIQTNHYWKYVEKYGVLGIALDNPLHVQSNQCRYDVVLRIDETVMIRQYLKEILQVAYMLCLKLVIQK